MNELVSIIIPLYNQANFIEETLLSVLNQSYKNIEIIVINDCSLDNPSKILKKYNHNKKIKIYNNRKRYGQSYSINKGFDYSNGKYIGYLSADDLLLPEAISSLVYCFTKMKVDIVYPSFNIISENGKFISQINKITFSKMLFLKDLKCLIGPGALVIKDAFKIKWNEEFKRFSDFDFWIRQILDGKKFYHCDKILASYRSHSNSGLYKEYSAIESNEIFEIANSYKLSIFHNQQKKAIAYITSALSHLSSDRKHIYYKYIIFSILNNPFILFNSNFIKLLLAPITQLLKKIKFAESNNFIIFCPNLKSHGGVVVLNSLLYEINKKQLAVTVFCNKKIDNLLYKEGNSQIIKIKNFFVLYLFYDLLIAIFLRKSKILTLHNLPMFFPDKKNQYVLFHNLNILYKKNFKSLLSFYYLKYAVKKINSLYVQTKLMLNLSKKYFSGNKNIFAVRVVDKEYIQHVINFKRSNYSSLISEIGLFFYYPATFHSHKNHRIIIEALINLSKRNIFPCFVLTLATKDYEKYISPIQNKYNLKIHNFPNLSHNDSLNFMKSSKALVFPSHYESFGLPLYEAKLLKKIICAVNEEYVFNICNPDYLFNSNNSSSLEKILIKLI